MNKTILEELSEILNKTNELKDLINNLYDNTSKNIHQDEVKSEQQ
jgi:hypothetical protein